MTADVAAGWRGRQALLVPARAGAHGGAWHGANSMDDPLQPAALRVFAQQSESPFVVILPFGALLLFVLQG